MLKERNILTLCGIIFLSGINFFHYTTLSKSQPIIWQLPLNPPLFLLNSSSTHNKVDSFPSIIPIPIRSGNFQFRTEFPKEKPEFSTAKFLEEKTVRESRFENALQALRKNRLNEALHARNLMTENSLERNTLTWVIALTNSRPVSSIELQKALQELQRWPGRNQIQENFEHALLRENIPPQKIIAALEKKKPETVAGMITLIQKLLLREQKTKAHALLIPWWYTANLDANEEQIILDKAKVLLQKEDYQRRFEAMLYTCRLSSAEKLASQAGGIFLHKFFVALYNKAPNVKEMMKYVEVEWKQRPVYIFARIQYLRRNRNYEQAANLLLGIPAALEKSVGTNIWWHERRILSRELLDIGKAKLAYQVVANHAFATSLSSADAEFHAGWYALRFLKNPERAFPHFARIGEVSSYPTFQARSFYWMGRTSEVLHKRKNAYFYFQQAARHIDTFYGQLANAHLNRKTPNFFYPHPTKQERLSFSKKYFVRAIKILEKADYNKEATMLYHALAEQLTSTGELSLLAAMAEKRGDYHTSLKIGKNAALKGFVVGALTHPLGAIPDSVHISSVGKALAYAVARQESEFNPTAISRADARGILQLLPTTARSIASRHATTYSLRKLSNDSAYNAMLGVHYLEEQLKTFAGSYILTFIAYNAGASRAKEWISRYGDPRKRTLNEIIDWIERIPFSETRNYVQRVMENYQIYKIRLKEETNIEQDLTTGYSAI